MRSLICRTAFVALSLAILAGADWRQFRGTRANGVCDETGLPTQWSDPGNGDTANIAWKAALPGRGPSSPIVVGGKVLVTASSGVNQDRLHVLAFDARTGAKQWERQFWATGRTATHPTSAVAANTPASDGQRVFAFFSSNDLACLDLDGNLLWYRGLAHDYPKAGNDIGMSSSPLVVGETVVVQIESQGDSFAAGIDTATGETRWRVERKRQANWCSPALLPGGDGRTDAVLLQSPGQVTAHEARTGQVLWTYKADFRDVPSSVAGGGAVFAPSKDGVVALDVSASRGSVSKKWQSSKISPASASLVVHDGRIYAINRSGVLTCGDAASGDDLWQLRLKGAFWATPVIADGMIYCFNDAGLTQVVQLGDKGGKLVASNQLDGKIQASPAVADGSIFVRSDQTLWRIGK